MTTPPVRVERRAGQRFSFLLPVSFSQTATGIEGVGFTQDLSSRGVFLLTDAPLEAGGEIEITLNMPSEITLGDSMRVRCRARVLRVERPAAPFLTAESPAARAETKIGVAVRLECYEYLTDAAEPAAGFARVAALHSTDDSEEPSVRSLTRAL